jgi:hypothetical protein
LLTGPVDAAIAVDKSGVSPETTVPTEDPAATTTLAADDG